MHINDEHPMGVFWLYNKVLSKRPIIYTKLLLKAPTIMFNIQNLCRVRQFGSMFLVFVIIKSL